MPWNLVTTPTPFRSVTRIVQPMVEAVSLGELKSHLRIEHDVADDDDFLVGAIAAARMVVEERLGMTLTATRWRAKLGEWSSCGCRGYEVPYPPLLVEPVRFPIVVTWVDSDGTTHVIDPADITYDVEEIPGRLRVGVSLAGPCCETNATVKWWAGVVNPSDVPANIRAAIKRIAGQLYTNRGDTAEAVMARDAGVDSLLAASSIAGRY